MRRSILLLLLLSAIISAQQPVTINWSTPQQTIDGFGAASASDIPIMTSAQAQFFYSSSGLWLDYIRIKIYYDLADCQADNGSTACVNVASGPTISLVDAANIPLAVQYGAKVWGTSWSPPPAMKSSGSYFGGSFNGGSTNFTTLANGTVAWIQFVQSNYGATVYAVSPQNEPDQSNSSGSCLWTAQQFHDYVPYLSSALSTAGLSNVKIMLAEPSSWTNSYSTTAMNDASVAPDIAILAAHNYSGSIAQLSWANFTTQHVWETEVSDFGTYDGSMTSGLTYAQNIHDFLSVAKVNGWNWWILMDGNCCTDNEGLTDTAGNVAKRAYVIGQWSKFVRPGWSMVSVTNSTGLLVTAFTAPSNATSAVVVVNPSSSAVSNQTFSVGATMGSTVTPWTTNGGSNSLEPSPGSRSRPEPSLTQFQRRALSRSPIGTYLCRQHH